MKARLNAVRFHSLTGSGPKLLGEPAHVTEERSRGHELYSSASCHTAFHFFSFPCSCLPVGDVCSTVHLPPSSVTSSVAIPAVKLRLVWLVSTYDRPRTHSQSWQIVVTHRHLTRTRTTGVVPLPMPWLGAQPATADAIAEMQLCAGPTNNE
jgi:hypothetical protein